LVGAVVVEEDDDATESQVLAVVPVDRPGVKVDEGFQMIALTETHTGRVHLNEVFVPDGDLVAGPTENALASLTAAPSTGSFQSSALALGVAAAAIEFLLRESAKRPDLRVGHAALQASHDQTTTALLEAAKGNPACSNEQLRAEANSLVLRATQAAMVAAKGAGFTKGHPVGRWCQEAMFFLVWSCPQAVQDSNLCELAGVEIESA
jgi:alkylation response protein AidB-like acyl-CoA dehydrogenase